MSAIVTQKFEASPDAMASGHGKNLLEIVKEYPDVRSARDYLAKNAENGTYSIYSVVEEKLVVKSETVKRRSVSQGTGRRVRKPSILATPKE